MQILVDDLEKLFDYGKEITEEEDRKTYLCVNNMLAYLFSWFICHIDEHISKNANETNIGKVCQLFMLLYTVELCVIRHYLARSVRKVRNLTWKKNGSKPGRKLWRLYIGGYKCRCIRYGNHLLLRIHLSCKLHSD